MADNFETAFTPYVLVELDAPLNPARVSVLERQGQRIPYISHREAVLTANSIFGYGNWGFRVEGVPTAVYTGASNSGKVQVLWGVAGTLSVRGGLSFTDVGTIEQNGDGVGAVDMAWKGAASNALVRCLRHYGDQFGLVLYDKEMSGEELQQSYNAWQREHGVNTPPKTPSAPPRPPQSATEAPQPIGLPAPAKVPLTPAAAALHKWLTGHGWAWTDEHVKTALEYRGEMTRAGINECVAKMIAMGVPLEGMQARITAMHSVLSASDERAPM